MAPKPLLFLDVDGVVLALPCGRRLDAPAPAGFINARAWGFPVWVPTHLQLALPALATTFELVWCTSWGEAANAEVSPLFGLPALPVIALPDELPRVRPPSAAAGEHGRRRRWWKHDGVIDYAGSRPVVWADDDMTSTARRWAATRAASTMLLQPAPARGLSRRQVA